MWHWSVYTWPLSGSITKAQSLHTDLKITLPWGAVIKLKPSYQRRDNPSYYSGVFLPTWKRFQTANINLRRPGPFYRERMPKINFVTSPRCSFSLAGKVSHVMTMTMISQLFLRNLEIVAHLSWEPFWSSMTFWMQHKAMCSITSPEIPISENNMQTTDYF